MSGGQVVKEPEEDATINVIPDKAQGDDVQVLSAQTVWETVLDYARRQGGPFSLRNAVRDLGLPYRTLSPALTRLVKKGLLRRISRGTYVLAEKK